MKQMKHYYNLYLKCDALLLADMFEHFVNNRLKNYGSSMSDLIWNAMLNMTKVEVEFISNPHKYLFFEKGMRGGISYVFKRNNRSRNNYLISYD